MFKRFLILIMFFVLLFSVAQAKSWDRFLYDLQAASTDPDGTFMVYVVSGAVTATMGNDFTLLYSTTTDSFRLLFSTSAKQIVDKLSEYHLLYSTTSDKFTLLMSTNTKQIVDKLNEVLVHLSTGVPDARYANKVSTGSGGKLSYLAASPTQNISPDDEVADASFLSIGGDSQVTCTFRGGIVYVIENFPATIKAINLADNPQFQCTLDEGTTLYWFSNEVN